MKVSQNDKNFNFVMEKPASQMDLATPHFLLGITNESESYLLLYQAEQPYAVILL